MKNIVITSLATVILIVAFMFGYPYYRVWPAEQRGRAEFAEAEQNRKNKDRGGEGKFGS